MQKVVEEYATERSEVESVMLEFTAALGWKINIQPQKQQTSPDPKETQTPPIPQNQQQPASAPQTPTKPALQKQPAPVQTSLSDLTLGQRNVSFGNYLWRVLDIQNGKALLLAEDILEQRPYHSEHTGVTWKACDLREHLNGEFLQTFGSQEQSRIAQTQNTNVDNQWYRTRGGGSTTDKVFLLSLEEVVKYFGDSGQLRERQNSERWIKDQYNSVRIAKYKGKAAWWWLRSPGDYATDAAYIDSNGDLCLNGDFVFYENGGVRPALWLNL